MLESGFTCGVVIPRGKETPLRTNRYVLVFFDSFSKDHVTFFSEFGMLAALTTPSFCWKRFVGIFLLLFTCC